VFCRATPEQRVERGKHFFNPPVAVRRLLGQGVHDRGEASVIADHVLSEEDQIRISRRMPAPFKAVSAIQKTIAAGEVWDLSMRADRFGLDDLRELYVMANIGTLVLESGAAVIIRGNIFSLLCQRVFVAQSGAPYHIGILPTPFSVDYNDGPIDGAHGFAGAHGAHGNPGSPMYVSSTIIGHTLLQEIGQDELHGEAGADGRPGTPGVSGRNGGMCYVAELTFREVRGELAVFVQAGAGGNGGDGGAGGAGGHGGDGTRGYNTIRGLFRGGNGGNGGRGGNGGHAGHAGSGGIASNVYVNVPARYEACIRVTSLPSEPGVPGRGGLAGPGGRGGAPGPGPRPGCDGMPGANGLEGDPGLPGLPGRSRPAPYVFLNEIPISSERMQYANQVELS
jgi:hypothetical protein